MRVFSQINNCQQKKKNKQTNKQNKKGRAPLLGLAKSIYYTCRSQTMYISQLQEKTINPLEMFLGQAQEPMTNLKVGNSEGQVPATSPTPCLLDGNGWLGLVTSLCKGDKSLD